MATPVVAAPAVEDDVVLLLYGLGAAAGETHLAEGRTYKYRLAAGAGPDAGPVGEVVALGPTELFELDPDDPATGRFTPQNHVGQIQVEVRFADGPPRHFVVEVRSTKLGYDDEYRTMLEQIADHAAEAVLQGFAPASAQLHADPTEAGQLDYRALAFLVARLRSDEFRAAMDRIAQAPHHRWVDERIERPTGRGLPSGARGARQLIRDGARAPVPDHLGHLPLRSLPRTVEWQRNVATFDTPPNRFVRHALRRWQGLGLDMLAGLEGDAKVGSGPRQRGRTEAGWLVDECDERLRGSVLREVGELTTFPYGDTVLLRKPGYREVLRLYSLAEATVALDAVLPDDPFSATQRNIATLYEYWCFIVLVRCLTDLCGEEPDGNLFASSPTGLSLVLRQGEASRIAWHVDRAGRQLDVVLWFNRKFAKEQELSAEIGSWAGAMRPDASLRLRPRSARPSEAADPSLDVWIHFDAKYRLEASPPIVVDEDADATVKREDLLRMHAYRDAIRRSAGVYVLYPGAGEPQHATEFHEVLPGIGAFPLRPTVGGAGGSGPLKEFLGEVLDHVANQAATAERAQFWLHRHVQHDGARVRPTSDLSRPPADEVVMLGYVRPDQWPWVKDTRRYNVRADAGRAGAVDLRDDLLTARLLVLWRRSGSGAPELVGVFEREGPWQVVGGDDLVAAGYPRRARGHHYLVAPINPAPAHVEAVVESSGRWPSFVDRGEHKPTSTTWEVLAATGTL